MSLEALKSQIELLTLDEKFDLYEFLGELLAPPGYWKSEEEFVRELNRRAEEVQSGRAKGVSEEDLFQRLAADEVMASLREKLSEKKT